MMLKYEFLRLHLYSDKIKKSIQAIRKERLDEHIGYRIVCCAGGSFTWQSEIDQEWQEEK